MLNKMLDFAKAGFHVFPLLKKLQVGENKLGTPKSWNHNDNDHKYAIPSTTDPDVILGWAAEYGEDIVGYGVNPRDQRALILDVDVDGKPGLQSLQQLKKDYPLSNQTLIVKSKSGGLHLYYKHPEFPVLGIPFPNYPGIDIRASNNFVVGPGSLGGKYSLIAGSISDELAELPEALIKILPRRVSATTASTLISNDIALSGEIPSHIALGERDNTLIKLIGSWVRAGLSKANVLVLLKSAIAVCDNPPGKEIHIEDYLPKVESTFGKATFTRPDPEPLRFFLDNAVYVSNHGAVYEIPGRKLRTKELEKLYAPHRYFIESDKGKQTEVSAFKAWLKRKDRKVVDGFGYHPVPEHIVWDDTQNCDVVNIYTPSRLAAKGFAPTKKVDCYEDFVEFCTWLFGEKADFMLDWAAHQIQFPHKKLAIAPVLVSEARGVGKNLFFDILSMCVGQHNSAVFNTEAVTEPHNDFILRAHLVLVNESYIDARDKWTQKSRNQLVENIKMLITDHSQQVNPKYVSPFTAKSYTNYIFASNNLAAVPIDRNDRRFEVVIIDVQPRDHEFYTKIWKMVNDEAHTFAVRQGLLAREITRVQVGMTACVVDEHKMQVIMANKSRLEEEVEQAIDGNEYVFNQDIVIFEYFAWFVLEKVDPGLSLEQVRTLFKMYCKPVYSVGVKKVPKLMTVQYPPLNTKGGFIPGGVGRKYIYTCRNHDNPVNTDKAKDALQTNYECTETGISKVRKMK